MPHRCSKDDARNVHTPLQDALAGFQLHLAPEIARLTAGQIGFPRWEHDQTLPNDENLQFLKSLNLPAASRFNQDQPSLLLHDLGCLGGDPDYKSYITQIFKPGRHTLLVNTSGAGKTRILLEGLCQHWGFYFSAQGPGGFATTSLGSLDLRDTIYTRLPNSPHFTKNLSELVRAGGPAQGNIFMDRLQTNSDVAGHLFRAVLLARLVLFEQYLVTMRSQGLRATNELKQRWLLLQIDPWVLDQGDVFDSLVDIICSQRVDAAQMQNLISIYWCSILSVMNEAEPGIGANSNIFLVVDEAQDAVEKFPDAFRSAFSEIGDARPRPVLRELINCWFTTVMQLNKHRSVACTFVITGTGILRDMMQEALSSSFFKAQPLVVVHTTGGLDTPEAQFKYIKKYLPERFLASQQGRALVDRLWYWLSGRFRFTAEYIALLIQNGLQRPHRLLNKYIEYFARIKPSDCIAFVQNEPILGPGFPVVSYERLQFTKLLEPERSDMLTTVKNLVYNYLRRSVLPDSAQTLGDDESLFVQYGIARYRTRADSDDDHAEVCEPLILLATAVWLDSESESLHKNLCTDLGSDSTTKNGFEDYLVYYFTRAFDNSNGTPLDRVFKFKEKDRNLSVLRATLVAVHRSEVNGAIVDFSDINFGKKKAAISLSGCLGENAKTAEQLEDWVQLRTHTAFCFPPLTMGPDILFVLKLHIPFGSQFIHRFIWVAVQAKFLLGGKSPVEYISATELAQVIRTVTPNRFYHSKSDPNPAALGEGGNADRRNAAVLEALDSLPYREPQLAGLHSVLRVVAVFPPEADLSVAVADSDGNEGHPVVTLRHEDLISRLSREHPTNKLKNVKETYMEKIEAYQASKRKDKHWKHRERLNRLQGLTFPDKWDYGTLAALPQAKLNDYVDCFLLFFGEDNVPGKGEGVRKTRNGNIDLLQRLLDKYLVAGGPRSVAKMLDIRSKSIGHSSRSPSAGAPSSSRGGSRPLYADDDTYMKY